VFPVLRQPHDVPEVHRYGGAVFQARRFCRTGVAPRGVHLELRHRDARAPRLSLFRVVILTLFRERKAIGGEERQQPALESGSLLEGHETEVDRIVEEVELAQLLEGLGRGHPPPHEPLADERPEADRAVRRPVVVHRLDPHQHRGAGGHEHAGPSFAVALRQSEVIRPHQRPPAAMPSTAAAPTAAASR
jgi:hypothetical protein